MHYHEHRDTERMMRCGPEGRHGRGGGRRHHGKRGGGGGGAFRIGRMLGDGDLRLIVLALLAKQPRHGYDIIKALEEHSSGIYSPSPGIVYPTLTFLEEAGYTNSSNDGNKRIYTITDTGQAHLKANREAADAVLEAIERVGHKMSRARDWMEEDERPRGRHKRDRDIPGVIPEMNKARRALKAAIAEKLEAPEDEQKRIASVLREAALAIAGSGKNDDIDLG